MIQDVVARLVSRFIAITANARIDQGLWRQLEPHVLWVFDNNIKGNEDAFSDYSTVLVRLAMHHASAYKDYSFTEAALKLRQFFGNRVTADWLDALDRTEEAKVLRERLRRAEEAEALRKRYGSEDPIPLPYTPHKPP